MEELKERLKNLHKELRESNKKGRLTFVLGAKDIQDICDFFDTFLYDED